MQKVQSRCFQLKLGQLRHTKHVIRSKAGDQVLAHRGSCIKYAWRFERTLVKRPTGLTFGEAAAVPVGVTALQALRNSTKV